MHIKQAAQCTLISLFLASSSAFADFQLNLTEGVTPTSHDIYNLHMTIFWICVAIGIVVFGIMIYSIIYHRKAPGKKPAQFHHNFWLEITWTIVPLLILVSMAIPAIKVLVHMHDESQPDISIKVTGYQWKWRYDYLDLGIHFFSNISTPYDQIHGNAKKDPDYLREVDHPLVVPIHKKIRFLITSNDVIHGWWVTDLGVKQDAIPGYINENWARINRPGIYRGQCSKLCGMNHGYMPIVVIAMTQNDFDKWVAQQKNGGALTEDVNKKWPLDELIQRGKPIYQSVCATCHKPDGSGTPPTFPNLKTSPVVNGPVDKHIHTVVFGVPGTAMQAFGKQYGPTDIAGVITYERNEIGNRKGDIIQPSDIAAIEGILSAPAKTTAAAPGIKIPAAKQTKAVAPAPQPAPVSKSTSTAAPAPTPAPTPAAKQTTLADSMKRGEQVYLGMCATCHKPDGTGSPPVFPALKGSPVATGPVDKHIDTVLNGRPGTAMQAFKDQYNDDDLAAVITYERNSFGNNSGTVVQPADIAAARQKK